MALQSDSKGISRLEDCDKTKTPGVAADFKIFALVAAESLITYTTVERQGAQAEEAAATYQHLASGISALPMS